nr:MAG TPA: hypothetical protein [Caudoviricetes sp.]
MIRFLIKQQFAWAEKCFDREGEIKKPFERYFASFINQVLKGQKIITLRAPNTLTGVRSLIYFSKTLDLIRYLIEVHEECNFVALTFKMNPNAKSMNAARNVIARYEK